jgi:hypothetical protein
MRADKITNLSISAKFFKCVLSCVFSTASYAYSKYTGIFKATLDTRGGGGGTFIGGKLLITAQITLYHWSKI